MSQYIYFDHQSKGQALIQALNQEHSGQAYTPDFQGIAFVLSDHAAVASRIRKLETLYQAGLRLFFIYPHAARPNLINDIYSEWPHVTAEFVVSHEHAEVMRSYGYKGTLYSIGWHLCPIREFQSHPNPRKILFGPIHPRCAEIDQKVNRAAWERLYKLAQQDAIDLTVRFVTSLESSGLQRVEHPRVRYVQGDLKLSHEDIDQADVVVGHQTFAWTAVARGVPTVMMAEDMPTHTVPGKGESLVARSWDKYKDAIRYPLDLLNGNDPLSLLQQAAASDTDIADWRRRMIGHPFDPQKFREIVESYL